MARSALDDVRIVRLSPPDTPLGMLQRGRGEGFLAAKSLPIDDARDLVWQCVVHDPRWDLQVESRGEYYAALIEELGLDIGRFRAEHCPKPLDDVDQRLVVDVLGELANRGHALATKALLTHVRPSAQWGDAIYELSRLPQVDYLEQLFVELETNFAEEDRAQAVARWKEEIPWADFAPERAWVQRGFVMKQEWSQSRGRAPELPDVAESAEVLLAYPWPPVLPKRLVHRLTHMLREGELELLLEAVKETGIAQWVAFNALGRLNHAGAIDVAAAILEADERGLSRRGAFRYIESLDPEHTLPLARSWYASVDGRATAARGILALHAEPVDTPLLVEQLKEAWSLRDFYSLCSYAQALELHPTAVPWGMCSDIFEQTEYSYSRGVVAETLVAADRARFIEQYGAAAAFDCNSRVRDLVAADD